jgi:gluconate 2-dehydrogenase gamma chain
MNRREALQQVAWLMGGAISAPALLGILNGCTPRQSAGWKPVFLNDEQGALVGEVAEIMIPRTDTPGAKDVGIPSFIDLMLKDAYPKEDQGRFIAGLKQFDAQAHEQYGRGFMQLDSAQRGALVRATHEAATAVERSYTGSAALERPFVLMTKELTLLGYFTSQAGATQVLQYNPLPGVFKGCVPLSEAGNGKTWAVESSTRF